MAPRAIFPLPLSFPAPRPPPNEKHGIFSLEGRDNIPCGIPIRPSEDLKETSKFLMETQDKYHQDLGMYQ